MRATSLFPRAALRDGACALCVLLLAALCTATGLRADHTTAPSQASTPLATRQAADLPTPSITRDATCSGPIEPGPFTDCVQASLARGALVVDTEGGLVSIAAYHALALHVRKTPVHVDHACWSACLWLLAASPRPSLGPDATVGLHFVHSHLGGNRTLVRARETRAAWRRLTGRDDLWHAYTRALSDRGLLPIGWQGEDWTTFTATKGGSFAMLSFWFPSRAELAAYGVLSGRDPRLDPEVGAR